MYTFTYHRASGLRQATNMLGKFEEPKLLAGGACCR
jgi:CO/xanthine dehydrogenase FAD-binding subunit